jgi:predicted peptidase
MSIAQTVKGGRIPLGSVLFLFALISTAESRAADGAVVVPEAGRQVGGSFTKTFTHRADLRYFLYTPKDYTGDSNKAWPLVLFLHGSGERGSDLNVVAVHGPPKLVKGGREFPFILVSPQCPSDDHWHAEELMALVDDLSSQMRVDKARIYATGLSMGGYGTWELAVRYPGRFAAVAPICGGGDRLVLKIAGKNREALKTLGVWAFHGGKDDVVPLAESQQMVDEFKRLGAADVKLTVYPEAGHDSWTEAYNTDALYEWLLSHHR